MIWSMVRHSLTLVKHIAAQVGAAGNCSRVAVLLLLMLVQAERAGMAQEQEPENAEGLELFEKKIRPVLVQHCYGCHHRYK